jgi:hypothetical protein
MPKEKIKRWLDDFWKKSDNETRVWLEVEIKRRFPEFNEWLQKQKESE